MRHAISKAILDPSRVKRAAQENSDGVSRFLPEYLHSPDTLECGAMKYWMLNIIQTVIITIVRLALRPRDGEVGNLDITEVEKVYDREAGRYNSKHHHTTRGMDLTWRRWAAWNVISFIKGMQSGSYRVLDLCTGTGLTVTEMIKAAKHWARKFEVVALDYNRKMLDVARKNQPPQNGVAVNYVCGDAMNLLDREDGLITEDSFDAATQVFGIGGISHPLLVFLGVLKALRPGGRYFMVDMHQPIAGHNCEMPILWKWASIPRFETLAYNNYTMPVVLNRLWGWRDTTLDFYQLPLTTFQDESGIWWGFNVISFEMDSQRWWLGLPFMPIAKIIVEKTKISEAEAMERRHVLAATVN